MTINEAIEYFYKQMELGNIQNDKQQLAYEIAINALDSIQQIIIKEKQNNCQTCYYNCGSMVDIKPNCAICNTTHTFDGWEWKYKNILSMNK